MSEADSKEIIWAINGDPQGIAIRNRTARQALKFLAAIQHGDQLALATREGLIYQFRHALDVPGIAFFLAFGTDNEKDEERWKCLYQVAICTLEATPTAGSEIWRRKWEPDTKAALAKVQALGFTGGFTNGEAIKQFLFRALCICLLASRAIDTLTQWHDQNSAREISALAEAKTQDFVRHFRKTRNEPITSARVRYHLSVLSKRDSELAEKLKCESGHYFIPREAIPRVLEYLESSLREEVKN